MNVYDVVIGGLHALEDYIAYYVLTCLIPAFLIAGAISAFLAHDIIIKYMGVESRKPLSFPLAAVCGAFLAVCSCTVIPIAAGLYRKGSSVGPAFIILWTAPATNLLALVYTGAILGFQIAFWRAVSAPLTGFLIGFLMVTALQQEETRRSAGCRVSNKKPRRTSLIKKTVVNALVLIILLAIALLVLNYLAAGKSYFVKVAMFASLMILALLYS